MYKIFLLLLVAALLFSCRQVGRDKWDFNPVSMALYEDIAPLSSMDKNVYLRRTRATGMLTVSGPGTKLDLVKFAEVRVTQTFQEKHTDYAVLQGKDKDSAPLCMLVAIPYNDLNIYEMNQCSDEAVQIRYTEKYIELHQPQTRPHVSWQIFDMNDVRFIDK